MSEVRSIRVGEDSAGDPVELPVEEVLTGRAFLTGKSGAGKSNTASVVIEKLLDAGYPVLIVDTDGEYYGLKEEYELLHAGADEECDIQVAPEHAEKIATLALEENVPVILDVSGYLDESEANELIRETTRHLFAKEKKLKKPFLLVVEEVHEYIPEGGGMDETGRMLIKVGKRGRKHGLGIVGISQRPADVKKDFITQANWLVWHRLTWNNDTKVVGRVVGSEYEEAVPELDDGEAFVQRDWTDEEVSRVQFDRKRTFDAGATPGLDDFERPELKSVSDSLVDDLTEISEAKDRREDRIEELKDELDRKNDRIAELEEELRSAKNVSQAAKRMADALSNHVGSADQPFGYEERLRQKNQRIEALSDTLEEREASIAELKEQLAEATDHHTFNEFEIGRDGDTPASESEGDERDELTGDGSVAAETTDEETTTETASVTEPSEASTGEASTGDDAGEATASEPDTNTPPVETEPSVLDSDGEIDVDEHMERLRRKGERLLAADDDVDRWQSGPDPAEVVGLLHEEAVVERVDGAIREARVNRDHAWTAIAALAARGSLGLQELERLVEPGTESLASLLSELRKRSLVVRDEAHRYSLNARKMRNVLGSNQRPIDDPGRQWAVE